MTTTTTKPAKAEPRYHLPIPPEYVTPIAALLLAEDNEAGWQLHPTQAQMRVQARYERRARRLLERVAASPGLVALLGGEWWTVEQKGDPAVRFATEAEAFRYQDDLASRGYASQSHAHHLRAVREPVRFRTHMSAKP